MWDYFVSLGPYQWIGLVFGIIYIVLATKGNALCWAFGIISCTSIAIEDFTVTKLYSDGILQIFYVAMAFLGLWQWKRDTGKLQKLKVKSLSISQHIIFVIVGLILSYLIWLLMINVSNPNHAFWDAFTTAFSVLATGLLVFQYWENWIHWIWIDAFYIYLYYDQSAPLFSILMFVYLILAIVGLREWFRKK